ncbi:MAG: Rpn family recombination-promoting nuclease/putative transposase [Propionibacteriaceae bacterium]|jgi:predicted transposase/invertase (TIGR01784 family)|nr:Rpn family recombination-promoting nuclease/putative transposase [Propionibacteriaceae bacterium]
MPLLKYRLTNDVLFKILFSQVPDFLKRLVAGVLNIRFEDITQFEVEPAEIPPEAINDKFLHLDINMVLNGQLINLEIQVANQKDYLERSLYNWATIFANALPAGEKYAELPRVIVISILDFKQFKSKDYHSVFQVWENSRGELLTDRLALHYLELKKLPKGTNRASELELLLSAFRARTVEDLESMRESAVPNMNEVIDMYWKVTADTKFREIARLKERARHDEASALSQAEQKGEQRADKKWKRLTAQKDAEIAKLTAEIARLQATISPA